MRKFKKIYIEITNVCNLDCSFCPDISRKAEIMDVERFEKIINKIKGYTNHVYFHIMGEPFLNKNLKYFLNICEKNNIKVNITTNGTLINEVKNLLLDSKSLRQVNFSIHSYEANNHKITVSQYLKDILSFVKEAHDNTDIISALRLWNLDSVYEAENKMNEEIIKIIQEEFQIHDNIKEALKEKNSYKIADNVYINMGEKFKWPSLENNHINERAFCYGLRDHIGILVDGTVVPCCLDCNKSIPLGNILTEDLKNIINNQRALNIYNGFSNRKIIEDLCKTCGFINRMR